ncbi:TPA: helix-turn-helix transcriptional regulator [Clostridioides difficile]|nr:helix-turn-helix transcriptional regulator [Clostridioides difficile]HBF2164230.1 helix-turn-helix transcriptional regulator [Clostridioides difficile]HBF3685559.1 helix-turn-helix transcriptional regulator [Clostridioides difficile]HBF9112915.1 helix-turn-helix transcriptional regulator [Clostridioides difficile]HBG7499125.1 helix-turn-helix transcriptional regulator [Clostridioides difficile]
MNRLRELRKENKYTVQDVADKLSVNKNSVVRWENGNRKVDTEKLIELSHIYNVSIDYILCLTDNRENIQLEEEEKQLLDNYRELDTKSKTIVQEQINTLKKLL